MIKKFNADMEI